MVGETHLNLSGQHEEFEDFLLLNPAGRQRLLEKYEGAACEAVLDFNWSAVPYNRVALVNQLVARVGPECHYLEIGCDNNDLFSAVAAKSKVGVDPVRGGSHRMTSDAFFERNKALFDVIFLDGLHTYEQLHRDVENALTRLRPGGFIAIHDLVPLNWREAHVPRINGAWTGDVWKVGVELARSEGIAFQIVLIDHGVGVIRHEGRTAMPPLRDLQVELQDAGFAEFHEMFETLPTLDWEGWNNWLAQGSAP